jgi:hypothetical protein
VRPGAQKGRTDGHISSIQMDLLLSYRVAAERDIDSLGDLLILSVGTERCDLDLAPHLAGLIP